MVGRPHPVYGEVPMAFVSLRDGAAATADQLLAHLTKSLAKYKLPTEIKVVPHIPKNPVGKVVCV